MKRFRIYVGAVVLISSAPIPAFARQEDRQMPAPWTKHDLAGGIPKTDTGPQPCSGPALATREGPAFFTYAVICRTVPVVIDFTRPLSLWV